VKKAVEQGDEADKRLAAATEQAEVASAPRLRADGACSLSPVLGGRLSFDLVIGE
jgi:hypothetical protein